MGQQSSQPRPDFFNSTAFSTISLEILPIPVVTDVEPEPGPVWSARATFLKALKVSTTVVQGLMDVVIWVVVVGLPVAVIATPIWFISRRLLLARSAQQ